MTENALQPELCPTCYQEVLKQAPGLDGKHNIYCEEKKVLAMFTVKNGLISRWRLISPLDNAEACFVVGLKEMMKATIQSSAEIKH